MHRLKSFVLAFLAFAAACSVSVGDGGVVLLRLPALNTLLSHVDLYAGGLLVVVEIFSRVVPSAADSSLLRFLTSLADSVLPDRAKGGGSFTTQPVLTYGAAQ